MKETVLLILLYGLVLTACAIACNHGWFGSRCQYKCHCLMNETCEQNNGTCQSGCEREWFGPECQYSDLATTKVTGNMINFEMLLDNNDTTCFNDSSSATKVNIMLNREYTFTWLRIHVRRPDILYNFNVTFGKENVADNIKCNNERRSAVSDTILDIHCQLNVTIKHVILEGEAVKSFCSIRISGGRNIALHENAQQSSNYTDTKTYSADLAVDGNTNGDFTSGKTCTHTAEFIDPSPWWSLTFQNPPRLVTRYILYNRADSSMERLKAFNLTGFGNDTSVVFNYTDKTSTAQSVYTVIQEPWLKPVSYLDIQPNNTEKILTLCEVEVYGDSICEMGKYGKDCEHTCNYCEQKESCFVSTGDCPSGCAAGFWGENCGKACSNDTYGVDCSRKCSNNCADGIRCNIKNGSCPNGCQAGFKNDYCNETCSNDTYGENCLGNCSNNCAGGVRCNNINGTCPNGCAAGFKNNYCNETCSDETYGPNCQSNCSNHCAGVRCNNITGICSNGCKAGYKNDYCNESCSNGTYGQNCKCNCSNHCAGGVLCSFVDGTCPDGCEAGFINEFCNESCSRNTYGVKCSSNCSVNCVDNGTQHICDAVNGVCSQRCVAGYMGSHCNISCSNGTFGQNCNRNCSNNCANDDHCNIYNGTCRYGCNSGFKNHDCFEREEDDDDQTGLIVGLVMTALVIVAIVIIGGIIFKRRRSYLKPKAKMDLLTDRDKAESSFSAPVQLATKPSERRNKPQAPTAFTESNSSPYYNFLSQKSTTAISVNDLQAFLSTHETDYFREQFQKAPELIGELSMEDGLNEENRHKNRYKNICAYDHSRVHLIINRDRHEGDYINASYIEGYKTGGTFIASQGPNKIMIDDFIRMLWEQKPVKVVMLTNLIEEGKVKCDQYWPEEEAVTFGDITVELATTHVFADYIIRKLTLSKSGKEQHNLTHFHFTSWPDKGVPSTPWALVDFEQRVAAIPTSRPTIIHCSAGVGRTGTFIALSNIVREAEDTAAMDFFTTLIKLRKDRINMIQTLEQYIFLHKAAYVANICMGTTVSASNIARRIDFLQKSSKSGKTYMQMEFEAICNVCAENDESTYKDMNSDDAKNVYENNQTTSNKHKNRVSNIVPRDQHRPHLLCNLKDSGDYINAVIVPSFTKQDNQLLTQLPLPTTIVDFWHLVTQYNVSLIVAYEVDTIATDPTVADYLPISEDESITCGPFDIATGPKTVTSIWEEQKLFVSSNKDRADKLMSSTTAAVKCTVTHLKCTSTDLSPKTLLGVVGQIRSRRSPKAGRTLYMCRNGATYSGIVCILSLLLDRIENDQHLTVPFVIGTIKCIRPQVIPDLDQYQVLYEVLKWYNETSNVYSNFGEVTSGNAINAPEASENDTDEEEAADNDINTYSNMK